MAAQFENDSVVAEIYQQHGRLGPFLDLLVLGGALQEDVAHQVLVGAVGDAHLDFDTARDVLVHPVGHRLGHHVGIGDDDRGAGEGLDLGAAHADAFDEALVLSHHHPVADLDRALGEQDQARDEVVDHTLEPEADADGQGAGDQRKRREVDAGGVNGEERRENNADIADPGAERVPDAHVQPGRLQEPFVQESLQKTNQNNQDDEEGDAQQQVRQREDSIADAEAREHPGDAIEYAVPLPAPERHHCEDRGEEQAGVEQQHGPDIDRAGPLTRPLRPALFPGEDRGEVACEAMQDQGDCNHADGRNEPHRDEGGQLAIAGERDDRA